MEPCLLRWCLVVVVIGWCKPSGALLVGGALDEECADAHANCATWAATGECDKNRGFMSQTCPQSCHTCPVPVDPSLTELGPERVVMDIGGYGSVTLGFYPNAAPITVAHILKLFRMGCYDTNHVR